MFQEYDEQYLDLMEKYEETFGEDFPAFAYEPEMGRKIMEKCLKEGRPYDPTSDPDFDPDADY